jgi:DNA polymerase V
MENIYVKRNIIAIDLKSFFASCECVERKLDPFTTPLVVCNPNQKGAITLAVTPYLKAMEVPSRTRAYLLPKNIKIIKAPPRMSLYIKKSKEVISIYLEFVSKEDMHIYSIDEVFLDVTDYLNLYKMSDYELAKTIMNRIKEKTGLTSTAGIGPNLLLAKIAMDIEAKHTPDNIAIWSYDDVPSKLWNITPLSKMWGIGPRMERNLNKLGLKSVGDIARYDKNKLKDKYGIIGEELWYHTNGIDLSRIKDFNYVPKEQSISHSQILFKDYNGDNVLIIIREMIEVLTKRLRTMQKMTSVVGLGIGYSKDADGGFYHNQKLDAPTNDEHIIYEVCLDLFDKYYEDLPIRKVSLSFGRLSNNIGVQLNLFETPEEIHLKQKENKVVDEIKEKYGVNSLIKASSLLPDSTAIERNKKIGGHNA